MSGADRPRRRSIGRPRGRARRLAAASRSRRAWSASARAAPPAGTTCCALVGGRRRPCAMALSDAGAAVAIVSLETEAGVIRRSAARIRRPFVSSGRCAISAACSRSACPTPGPGSITVPGRGRRERGAGYNSCRSEGDGLHQIPVGPVHAGIIEPGHFRFTANGETVVRLEQRLGYVHKGIEGLIAGAEVAGREDRRLVSRATARWPMPGLLPAPSRPRSAGAAAARRTAARRHGRARAARAPYQRCRRDLQRRQRARQSTPTAPCSARTCCRGRRLLRPSPDDGSHRAGRRGGRSVGRRRRQGPQPAGAARGDPRRDPAGLRCACRRCRIARSPPASFRPSWSRQYAAGGFVGRASGRAFDARKALPYAPYDQLDFEPQDADRRRCRRPRLLVRIGRDRGEPRA